MIDQKVTLKVSVHIPTSRTGRYLMLLLFNIPLPRFIHNRIMSYYFRIY